MLQKTYEGEDFMRIEYDFEQYIRLKQEKEAKFAFKKWTVYLNEYFNH